MTEKPEFALHFSQILTQALKSSADSYVAYVEHLIFEEPHEAPSAAELLPAIAQLVSDPDQRARALGIAASAFVVGRRYDRAKVHLAEAAELPLSLAMHAELLSRHAQILIRQEDWSRAQVPIQQGLELLRTIPGEESDQLDVKAQLLSQAAGVKFFVDRDHMKSAQLSMQALRLPGSSRRTKNTAIRNLTHALGVLDMRTAFGFLDTVYVWRQLANATRTDFLLAWIDGYLRAHLFTDKELRRGARNRLIWAANGLFDLGCRSEAAMCLLDLLTVGYHNRARGAAADVATKILDAIRDDRSFADEVREEAKRYLGNRAYAVAQRLGVAVRDHVHPGLFPARHDQA
ncbi:MAG: hypothetical protein AAGD38_05085 [Acidobacteriota bacterium]